MIDLFVLQLDKGCAEIEVSKWELYYLYPSINAVSENKESIALWWPKRGRKLKTDLKYSNESLEATILPQQKNIT